MVGVKTMSEEPLDIAGKRAEDHLKLGSGLSLVTGFPETMLAYKFADHPFCACPSTALFAVVTIIHILIMPRCTDI